MHFTDQSGSLVLEQELVWLTSWYVTSFYTKIVFFKSLCGLSAKSI